MEINDLKNAIRMIVGALLAIFLASYFHLNIIWCAIAAAMLVLMAQGRDWREKVVVFFVYAAALMVALIIQTIFQHNTWLELLLVALWSFLVLLTPRWRQDLVFPPIVVAAITFLGINFHSSFSLSTNLLSFVIGLTIAFVFTLVLWPDKRYTTYQAGSRDMAVYVNGLRVVLMAVLAFVLSVAYHSHFPGWAAMTCVIVEQNNLLRTFRRVKDRVLGSVLGLVVVVLLNNWVSGHLLLLKIVLPLLFIVTLYFIPRRYFWGTTGITVCVGMIYYLFPFPLPISANAFVVERAVDTGIGALTAVMGYGITHYLRQHKRK